jgi:hypothetical protein
MGYSPESTPRDIAHALNRAGIDCDYRTGETAIDSSDYLGTAEGNGNDSAVFCQSTDGDDVASVDAQGILPAREFFKMCDDMGVICEDCETMGSIGGPLGGHVPDVPYTIESPLVVLSMRATPFLQSEDGTQSALSPASWERIRGAMVRCDPWCMAKGQLR